MGVWGACANFKSHGLLPISRSYIHFGAPATIYIQTSSCFPVLNVLFNEVYLFTFVCFYVCLLADTNPYLFPFGMKTLEIRVAKLTLE